MLRVVLPPPPPRPDITTEEEEEEGAGGQRSSKGEEERDKQHRSSKRVGLPLAANHGWSCVRILLAGKKRKIEEMDVKQECLDLEQFSRVQVMTDPASRSGSVW
ncbi:Hypothetical predicted protein [Podarcis lilfordi]|uniref:Uncharacterized protein n=1 Tax=Podarcis lilfordi TaxID=74358 RepID=A0AA35PAW8_9SAUR|nr:Hypothetical predicted protein [Podarcis lilfordi]